jgi:uncharacterized membrane protein YeaQ/YmgE (transglycosylase-associated protein family)
MTQRRAWILSVVCVVAGVTGWLALHFTAHGKGWAADVVSPILAGGTVGSVVAALTLHPRRKA